MPASRKALMTRRFTSVTNAFSSRVDADGRGPRVRDRPRDDKLGGLLCLELLREQLQQGIDPLGGTVVFYGGINVSPLQEDFAIVDNLFVCDLS